MVWYATTLDDHTVDRAVLDEVQTVPLPAPLSGAPCDGHRGEVVGIRVQEQHKVQRRQQWMPPGQITPLECVDMMGPGMGGRHFSSTP